jgi:hypothetical protein
MVETRILRFCNGKAVVGGCMVFPASRYLSPIALALPRFQRHQSLAVSLSKRRSLLLLSRAQLDSPYIFNSRLCTRCFVVAS